MIGKHPDLSGRKTRALLYVCTTQFIRVIALEGTVRSGKTIDLIEVFCIALDDTPDYLHLIACKDTDAINDNIIESNGLGIIKRYPNLFKLKKDKIGGYYLQFKDTKGRMKKILLCGYDKASSWVKILGKTLGIIFINEANTASKQFVDECFARQASAERPLTLLDLNGDDPSHWIYQEYINYCKPLLREEIPQTILQDMDEKENRKGWYYFHFNFRDNPIMTESKIQDIMNIYPVGSYYYNTKVLGIRGRSEGSVFAQYIVDRELEKAFDTQRIIVYDIGLDIGNNEIKRGTILTLTAIERGFTDCYVVESYEAKSMEVNSLVSELTNKIGEWYDKYDNFRFNGVWMDSYGAIQLMLETLRREITKQRMYRLDGKVNPCLKFGDEKGRKARLELLMMLISQRRIHFNEKSKNTLNSLKKLVYNEKDGLPLDENQLEMDYYDSLCYALTPHIRELTRMMKGA